MTAIQKPFPIRVFGVWLGSNCRIRLCRILFGWTAFVLHPLVNLAHKNKTSTERFSRHSVELLPNNMTYYGHTADDNAGRRLPEGHWQLLREHLRNVARLAKQFAEPLGLAEEAELAGLLHDLGKYREEFQAYLRGERSSSVETQHAIFGAAWAKERSP